MWPIGFKFEYKSNYSDKIITGIIGDFNQPGNYPKMSLTNYKELKDKHLYNVISTRGATYNLAEIEIETISEVRDRRLNDIGI